MRNNNAVLTLIIITAILVAAHLYFENIKKERKIKELEEDKIKIILDSLKQHKNLSNEIREQIEKLILEFESIDSRISNELAQALTLIQIGQPENAIEDLVKIMEHLLTEHYKNSPSCKAWLKQQNKKFDLHNLLTFCKTENKINAIEFQFFIAIKTIRNKEDHTIDLNLDSYLNTSGLITAIGAIFKISSIVYPKQNLS